jgi:hypothetical protein
VKKAKWFSRHSPTRRQLDEIECMGFNLVTQEISRGMLFGAINITSAEEVNLIVYELTNFGHQAVFGVFPPPILEGFFKSGVSDGSDRVKIFSSWNVLRSQEGEKPTFEHKCWVRIM